MGRRDQGKWWGGEEAEGAGGLGVQWAGEHVTWYCVGFCGLMRREKLLGGRNFTNCQPFYYNRCHDVLVAYHRCDRHTLPPHIFAMVDQASSIRWDGGGSGFWVRRAVDTRNEDGKLCFVGTGRV